jgi:O-methyltransferase
MAQTNYFIDTPLQQYITDHTTPEPELFAELRLASQKVEGGFMLSSAEQGRFMQTLIKLMQAKNILELGTFTGYSTLWMADALPDDGKIVTCERYEWPIKLAKQFWTRAGVLHKIDLRLGQALDLTQALLDDENQVPFDFCFIDADKAQYPQHYERCYQLTRPGGLIALDNTLWRGRVLDTADQSKKTAAIRQTNDIIKKDSRVEASIIPMGDGLTLIFKR